MALEEWIEDINILDSNLKNRKEYQILSNVEKAEFILEKTLSVYLGEVGIALKNIFLDKKIEAKDTDSTALEQIREEMSTPKQSDIEENTVSQVRRNR